MTLIRPTVGDRVRQLGLIICPIMPAISNQSYAPSSRLTASERSRPVSCSVVNMSKSCCFAVVLAVICLSVILFSLEADAQQTVEERKGQVQPSKQALISALVCEYLVLLLVLRCSFNAQKLTSKCCHNFNIMFSGQCIIFVVNQGKGLAATEKLVNLEILKSR